jgi:predicted RNA-binding Zn-ribbon protein involved in translation (DUF1610 family)
LKPLKLKPLKPLLFPGDLKPSKQKITCQFCGSEMPSPDPDKDEAVSTICPNCGKKNSGIIEGFHKHIRDEKGKQFNPFSVKNPVLIPKNTLAASNFKKNKKNPKIKEIYRTNEIKQCPNINNKNKKDDYNDITKSCLNLEIDG